MAEMNVAPERSGDAPEVPDADQKPDLFDDIFPHYSRLAARRGRRIPFTSSIEITEKCNLRCFHCQVYSSGPKAEMPLEQICSAIDQLAKLNSMHFIITGGEPLLHRDFFEIVEHAKRREFLVQLSTNGSLFTRQIARRLARLYIFHVYISVYGMNEETTRKVTGVPGICQRVLDNARMLIKEGIPVTLRMPLLKENIGQTEELRKFSDKIGAIFYPLQGVHERYDACPEPLDHMPTAEQLMEFFEAFPKLCEPVFSAGKPDQQVCEAADGVLTISARGYAMPCAMLRSRINIRDASLADILYDDPFFRQIQDTHWRDMRQCLKCPALPHCGPCPGRFKLETGTLTKPAKKSVCPLAWQKKKIYERIKKR